MFVEDDKFNWSKYSLAFVAITLAIDQKSQWAFISEVLNLSVLRFRFAQASQDKPGVTYYSD